jgi:hypothetical protein
MGELTLLFLRFFKNVARFGHALNAADTHSTVFVANKCPAAREAWTFPAPASCRDGRRRHAVGLRVCDSRVDLWVLLLLLPILLISLKLLLLPTRRATSGSRRGIC